MRGRSGPRGLAGLTTIVACIAAALFIVPTAFGASGAGFTTTDTGVDGTGHCKNGNEAVNCNIYSGKQYVWMNGGPVAANLDPGDYFFAVLVPGGQGGNQDPNDGTDNNLSDDTLSPEASGYVNSDGSTAPSGDAYGNRTFTVNADHSITYNGTHDQDLSNGKIRLMPYDDTTNNGGVYIMAICSLADGYPVAPSSCKYDAFKVQKGETPPCTTDCGPGIASDLTVTKDAAGAYKTTWTWGIAKSVDKTLVRQNGGSVTFNYTVTVTHDSGTNSAIKVTGGIDVSNPNADDAVTGVDVADQLSDGTNCTISGGSNNGSGESIAAAGSTHFTYSCSLSGTTVPTTLTNTVTVTWPTQFLATDGTLVGSFATYTFPADPGSYISFTQTKIDDCVNVTDTFKGTLGTVCSTDASPKAFTYSRTVTINPDHCVSYDNTATFTTNTSGTTGSASQTVTACPTVNGLTIGYWQNKNGQARITGAGSTAGVCNLTAGLRAYAPFQDLSATSTCTQVATYVYNVIKAANASGSSMNAMLKAQMLATALNVAFGVTNGNELIDLTQVCKMIDGSGGSATCSGTAQNVSAAFGGATKLTVVQILQYAASQSNSGGSVWYGQVKATQELAKNTFDAINNGVALSA